MSDTDINFIYGKRYHKAEVKKTSILDETSFESRVVDGCTSKPCDETSRAKGGCLRDISCITAGPL
jgi:hypothetical protein